MKTEIQNLKPRQRILQIAMDLFYRQGYIATGINQIIEEANVSKASFYSHFKSKEQLCTTYLRERREQWMESLVNKINRYHTPLEKFLAPIEFLAIWFKDSDFRGCAFINVTSEIPDIHSDIRKEAAQAKLAFRDYLIKLTSNLRNSSKEYEHIEIEFIANTYYLLIEGAIVVCQINGETWPIADVRKSIKKLIGLSS